MQIANLNTVGSLALHGSAQKSDKLHDAAQQFEALMIGEMLKTVRAESSSGWLGSGESAGSDSAMEMAQGQFAQALATSGGLGLSRMIEASVGNQTASQNEKASPKTLPGVSPK